MHIQIRTITNDKNYQKFRVGVLSFCNKECAVDRIIIKSLYNQASDLANKINTFSANYSGYKRDKNRLLVDCYIGILSEYAWKSFINMLSINTIVVEEKNFLQENQIDLKILGTDLSIEVRSSFVRNGIKFALFNKNYKFDIIGPYVNAYKSKESLKNFYLRVLYHFDNRNLSLFFDQIFNSNRNNQFNVYLVGGATLEMMQNKNLYIEKTMQESELLGNALNQDMAKTNYRVIPIFLGMDAVNIAKEIIKAGLQSNFLYKPKLQKY